MITVTLTQEEVSERARSLAQYANKLAELADEEEGAKARHKQLMADIKERRLDISNELRRLSRAVRLGVEERSEQQVLFDEEKRLEEFRRERETRQRAEELIAEGKEMIEQQQQAEIEATVSLPEYELQADGTWAERERLHREAVANWRRDRPAGDFIDEIDAETEEQRAAAVETEEAGNYQEEWFAALTTEEREKYHAAPCSCGHSRDWHGEEDKDICEKGCGVCKCEQYHCPVCDTKGGHQATCEHYVLGEGTPVQKADALNIENHSANCYVQVIPKGQRTKHSCNCKLREQYQEAFAAQADDFTAERCASCGRIDGAHAPECVWSDALRFEDYLAYAKANYKSNHQSHARKMELSKLKDDEVRAWKQQQDKVKERREQPAGSSKAKLPPVEAAIDR